MARIHGPSVKRSGFLHLFSRVFVAFHDIPERRHPSTPRGEVHDVDRIPLVDISVLGGSVFSHIFVTLGTPPSILFLLMTLSKQCRIVQRLAVFFDDLSTPRQGLTWENLRLDLYSSTHHKGLGFDWIKVVLFCKHGNGIFDSSFRNLGSSIFKRFGHGDLEHWTGDTFQRPSFLIQFFPIEMVQLKTQSNTSIAHVQYHR